MLYRNIYIPCDTKNQDEVLNTNNAVFKTFMKSLRMV